MVRELGSDRRETGRSLSVVGVGYLSGEFSSTRGPRTKSRWCYGCPAKGKSRVAMLGMDKR